MPLIAPLEPADTGLPVPALYLPSTLLDAAYDLAAAGAIFAGAAWRGQDMPLLRDLAVQVGDDLTATLAQVQTSPGASGDVLAVQSAQQVAHGRLADPSPTWMGQVRGSRMVCVLVGEQPVVPPFGALAFQPRARVGVAMQIVGP